MWDAEDMLGRGDREKRQAAIDAQRKKDQQDLLAAQAHNTVNSLKLLAARKAGQTAPEPEDLPEWARR